MGKFIKVYQEGKALILHKKDIKYIEDNGEYRKIHTKYKITHNFITTSAERIFEDLNNINKGYKEC